MNLVVLIGRLTRDPELKFGQSGKAYSRFSLAVDRPFAKGEADFINCVAFGKTAELIGEYLRKGKKVAVNGKLQMNKYEVNGEKRTSYDVVVDSMEFIDSRGDSSQSNDFNPAPSYSAPKVAEQSSKDDFNGSS
ncbi:MAG: single-stranded DNA-binding protein, partial [Cetobacterium sp.]